MSKTHQIKKLKEDAQKVLDEFSDPANGYELVCDHSVGICACKPIGLLENLENSIKSFEEALNETISIEWGVDDVLHQAKQDKVILTKEQAIEILDILKSKHDATIGISWETIRTVISLYTGNMYINQKKYV